MDAKTEQAQKWAKENLVLMQQTATPFSVNDITNALFNLVDTYRGGDARLFLYSQDGIVFFFNVNSTRSDVRSLVGKVSESGGMIFGSDFSKSAPKFIPIMAIKPSVKH